MIAMAAMSCIRAAIDKQNDFPLRWFCLELIQQVKCRITVVCFKFFAELTCNTYPNIRIYFGEHLYRGHNSMR